MGNSLLAVRDINHKYIVVGKRKKMKKRIIALLLVTTILPCNLYAAESESEMTYDELLSKYEELLEKYNELETKFEELIGNQNVEMQTPSEASENEAVEYGPGVYKVGTDMPAGTYFLTITTPGRIGYVAVSADSNADDIIYNEIFDQNVIAEFYDGEYVDLSRCSAARYTKKEHVDLTAANFEAEIGVHLPSGEYRLEIATPNRTGYYVIYSDNRFHDIITNDVFENNCYVTVSDGQFLIIKNAHIIQ